MPICRSFDERETGWFHLVTVDEILPSADIEDCLCGVLVSGCRVKVETHSVVNVEEDGVRVG